MFDRLKSQLADVERAVTELKADLTKLGSDLADVKRTLSRVLGENHGLRQENDRLLKFGIVPAARVKRHAWPDIAPEQESD
jgi:regulator of replication initiation timing